MTTLRLTSYQRRLYAFLGVASFFEGYDFFALTQVLPNLRAEFGLGHAAAGRLVAVANLGTVLAWFLVRKADRWGRRRVLSITILGYALATFMSGLAPEVYSFTAAQCLARFFLLTEWAVAMVYAAEEFPAARRATVIGVIQALSSLGSIVCAGLVPFLVRAPWGWRSVYFVGVVPLLLMAVARRGLRESSRFAASSTPDGSAAATSSASAFQILRSPWRTQVFKMAAIWFLTYVCTQTGITFWKDFVLTERGYTDLDAGRAISLAAVGSMPLVFLAGKLLDVVGRRPGAAIIFLTASLGTAGAFSFANPWLLGVSLGLGIIGASSVLPVLNSYTTELFPTSMRADAFAWSNNLLGRIGYVLAPLAAGQAAAVYGWGASVRVTALSPLLALTLILLWMPETRGRDLDETSAGR
jgi:putative MFS transporter